MHWAMGLCLFIEVPISPSCEPGKYLFVGMYGIKRRRCSSPKSTWDPLEEWGCGGSTAAEKRRSWPVAQKKKKKTLGRGHSVGGTQELQRCNWNICKHHTSTTDLPKPNLTSITYKPYPIGYIFLPLDVSGFVNSRRNVCHQLWSTVFCVTVFINSSDHNPWKKTAQA